MLALTTFDDDDAFAALRAGAVGYLFKDVSGDRLVEAVLAAALFLAEGKVKNHVTNVLAKLGARDRPQAALRGRALELI